MKNFFYRIAPLCPPKFGDVNRPLKENQKFKPTAVTSVAHGKLAVTTTAGSNASKVIAIKLPLKYADFVLFEC